MNFLRNPEIKLQIILWALCSAVFLLAGFLLAGWKGFLLMAAACLFFCILYLVFTWKRYQRLQDLATEIDRILHDSSRFDLSRFTEGELGILQSEIYKMTMRLREQTDILKKDRTYLADSIADISHQIRTPLTSIHLLVQLLSDPDLDQTRHNELIMELQTLLGRIDWLINTLLKISRLDAGTLAFEQSRIQVRKLLKQCCDTIGIAMDLRNQELRMDCGEDIFFQGDFERSTEAITNILKNSMEHTPEGGYIQVTCQENSIYTEIVIEDNGSGIAKEDLPNIFKRFYKGSNSSQNSIGIGLAFSRMMITAQNGMVKAENRAEGGSRFTIRFYKTTV